jgi:hypothetical protein
MPQGLPGIAAADGSERGPGTGAEHRTECGGRGEVGLRTTRSLGDLSLCLDAGLHELLQQGRWCAGGSAVAEADHPSVVPGGRCGASGWQRCWDYFGDGSRQHEQCNVVSHCGCVKLILFVDHDARESVSFMLEVDKLAPLAG